MTNKTRKGFTLIEIVIVLAIAALIMVVVFLAVQGAQRAQRDNFRKDVTNRAAAAVQSYRGNRADGANPTKATDIQDYVSGLSGQGITIGFTDTAITSCSGTTLNSIWLTTDTTTNIVSANTCLESGLYSRPSQ